MNEFFAQSLASLQTPLLTQFFIFMTRPGMALFLVILGIYLLYKKQYRLLFVYAISTTGAWIIAELLKKYFAIERPISVLYETPESFSFPSGHTTAAFALWPLMEYFSPPVKWALRFILLLFPFSRLYLGVHYLSDIIAGAVLGLAVGYWARWIERKNEKKK